MKFHCIIHVYDSKFVKVNIPYLFQTTGEDSGYRAFNERPPPINLPYEPPDVCSTGGAAQFAYSTIVVVLMAMLSFLL